MSLLDALLLEPYRDPREVWLVPTRADGALGSGTMDDPFDCSVIQGPSVNIQSLVQPDPAQPTIAEVTTETPHGFSEGDRVSIFGMTGDNFPFDYRDAQLWSGNFLIEAPVTERSFRYRMVLAPGHPPLPPSSGPFTCYRHVCRFDEVMRGLPGTGRVAVHLGPGVFSTRGFAGVAGSWVPRPGRITGSGIDVTIVKIVDAVVPDKLYWAFGNDGGWLSGFELEDMTIDANLAEQPVPPGQPWAPVACGGCWLVGKHIHLRRLRVINFGTQTPDQECFALANRGTVLDLYRASGQESVDCLIEECILEKPGSPTCAKPLVWASRGATAFCRPRVRPPSAVAWWIASIPMDSPGTPSV